MGMIDEFITLLGGAVAKALDHKEQNGDRNATTNAVRSDFELDGVTLIKYHGSAEAVTVPDTVKIVGEEAFARNEHIKSVVFQENLYYIKSHAFLHCKNLVSVQLPDYVESIEECAFLGCSSLESIVIPEGVCRLGYRVFKECTSLERLTLPDTVSELYCFSNLDRGVVIRACRGSMAEKLARQAGYPFEPLDETVQKGFHPVYAYGDPIVYYNPEKGVCRQIITNGHFVDFPGYEHPDMLLEHYDGEFLPEGIAGRVEFTKMDNGYRMTMNIQRDSWYELGESGYEHIDIFADLNDEGDFTTKFRLSKIGAKHYENTDLEEREYQEFLKKKQNK